MREGKWYVDIDANIVRTLPLRDSYSSLLDSQHEWRIYPKLATQPFMDIAPSNPFALFVNDLDDHRGIGIITPKDKDTGKGGEEFTFKWDHEGFTQYAGNTEISGAVPLESVDIKLYYLSECLVPGTFIGCNEVRSIPPTRTHVNATRLTL